MERGIEEWAGYGFTKLTASCAPVHLIGPGRKATYKESGLDSRQLLCIQRISSATLLRCLRTYPKNGPCRDRGVDILQNKIIASQSACISSMYIDTLSRLPMTLPLMKGLLKYMESQVGPRTEEPSRGS